MFNLKLFLKVVIIGVLVLLSLIPLELITGIIRERKYRLAEVEEEVGDSWGKEQKFKGPLLTIPYKKKMFEEDSLVTTQILNANFFPEDLNIEADLKPEIRYRSLYKVILYNLDMKVEGYFDTPDFSQWKINNEDVLWDEAFITIGITDMRGIKEEVRFKWNDSSLLMKPGFENKELFHSGMHVMLPEILDSAGILELDRASSKERERKRFDFAFNLNLNGSRDLSFIPIGKQNNINISSDWSNPSFYGSFLPTERQISDTSFKANWALTYFGRSFKQSWLDEERDRDLENNLNKSKFGVKLLLPVDYYQMSTRAAKYGILFISLTFVIYFLVEILGKVRLHPMQYLLVGSALALFYLLLVSLSEQVDFFLSYIIAAGATVILTSIYTGAITKNKKHGALLGGFLVILYGYLLVLLQLQDYSLLLGSVILFVVLSIFMLATRKINWYEINLAGSDKSKNKIKSFLDRIEIKKSGENEE